MSDMASAAERTILIVDDNPVNLGVVVEHLEYRGFQVAVALGGQEALDRARFLQPDLILLDVMMPGIDGFETCRRLKSQPDTRFIPVIFMTALGDVTDKTEGFAAGGVDYVSKPFQVGDLLARVGTHIELGSAQARLRRELEAARGRLESDDGPGSRYRRLFERGDEGILLIDRAEMTIRDANPAAAAMIGKTQAELIGEALTGLPGLARVGEEAIGRLVGRGQVALGRQQIDTPGGKIAIELFAAFRRDDQGELIELILHPSPESDFG